MDIYKLLRSLPSLKNYGKDVDLWIYDFEEVTDLWDIQNPKRRLVFMKECVNYALKEVLKKNLKNIDEEMRKLITVEDYINSIKPRIYPCLRVLEQECENIEEAIKIAEKASRIEEKLKFKIDFIIINKL
ncbi:hypothetical protein LY90DRAFT_518399 [Neocallimastix californiae]|uniref:Uncharacterized protein n=1 Tax=Neocallimastix californiae TaxID=1754190 RepID=A0A1Y1ZP81_9FUNG|nr:hypothetical protein LY90DRAFT_518399 [Neocallimastix californiae]|eukprot:ORY12059.1 hypothetical protein LY90DRAFT_518399 [Neocallimastix californiae]